MSQSPCKQSRLSGTPPELNHNGESECQQDNIQQMNSAKFDMIEDMALLTHLKEASVLYTLQRRYDHWVIDLCVFICFTGKITS
ncbi:Myosin-15 [Fukomys damarensis]|uniref:Myosin-15 n=1 Tax=Fukomys damarensis TaxID=885580 RepID=A0A091DI90_FUKDA|nr:Myosin-15 [Fukomys damarensis]